MRDKEQRCVTSGMWKGLFYALVFTCSVLLIAGIAVQLVRIVHYTWH